MIEKEIRKYVIADADTGKYLKAILREDEYKFVTDIEVATKAFDKSTANSIMNKFYEHVNTEEKTLVSIPVKITYEILDEENETDMKMSDMEILNEYINMIQSKTQEVELNDNNNGYFQWL